MTAILILVTMEGPARTKPVPLDAPVLVDTMALSVSLLLFDYYTIILISVYQ